MARTHMSGEDYQKRFENFERAAVAADPTLADPDAMKRYLATVPPSIIAEFPLPESRPDYASEIKTLGRYVPARAALKTLGR